MRYECNEDGLDVAITQGVSTPILYEGRNFENSFGVSVLRDASGAFPRCQEAPSLPSRLALVSAKEGEHCCTKSGELTHENV